MHFQTAIPQYSLSYKDLHLPARIHRFHFNQGHSYDRCVRHDDWRESRRIIRIKGSRGMSLFETNQKWDELETGRFERSVLRLVEKITCGFFFMESIRIEIVLRKVYTLIFYGWCLLWVNL